MFNKVTYDTFVYDNNSLEKVLSYKYIDNHHKLNCNYNIEKGIDGGWKTYYELKKNCKLVYFWIWDKKKLISHSSHSSSLMGCSISIESWRKIE
jgi:hypothetical protein